MARLEDVYRETEKALFGTLVMDDGTRYEEVVIPKSQIRPDGTLNEWIVKQKLADLSIGSDEDRFGRPIPRHINRIIKGYGRDLVEIGFREAQKKPNLFFLKLRPDIPGGLMIFADLRGSEIVPITELTMPLIWCKFDRKYRLESLEVSDQSYGQHFILHEEAAMKWSIWDGFGTSPMDTSDYFCNFFRNLLELKGIPSRVTADVFSVHRQAIEENSNTVAEKQANAMGEYSSYIEEYNKQIKEVHNSNRWDRCRLCGVLGLAKYNSKSSILEWHESGTKLEMHHVSYVPEVVMPVCKSCHVKIHNSNEYTHLKPEMTRKKWLEMKSKSNLDSTPTSPGTTTLH